MERQVPGAAGDPALPQPRRRPLRPPPQHPVQDPGDRRPLRRGDQPLGRRDRPGRPRSTAQVPHHRHRLPVLRPDPEHPRPRDLPGRVVPHRRLAPRGRRLHRQAGRRDRHRLQRGAVDPGDRQAGRPPLRLPAHAAVHHPGPPRHGRQGVPRRASRRTTTRSTRRRAASLGGMPVRPDRAVGPGGERRGAPSRLRGGVEGGRLQVPPRLLLRHQRRSPGQRHRVGVHPREDPRDRERPRGRREARSRRPSVHARSAPSSTRTTSTPTTATTSPSSTSAMRRSRRSPRPASAPRTASTSSTSSSSPPASTR